MTKVFTLPALLVLAACGAQVNTTSGEAYLSASTVAVDSEIATAANVEADLRFPARIGLVRLVYGDVTTTPASEVAEWEALLGRMQGFGDFVPITQVENRPTTMRLRQAAAAQQIDYLMVTDLDVSGGTAQVQFLDVRNGYIYGTAQAASPSGGENGFWGGRISNPTRLDRATGRLTTVLLPEIEDLMTQLAGVANR